MHEQVVEFVRSTNTSIRVTLVYEPTPLGSTGTLRENRLFAEDSAEFFAVYADNLSDADPTALLSVHPRMRKIAAPGLFRAPVPGECGVVVPNGQGTVIDFQEKPSRPPSDLAFAGIIAASPEIFDLIPERAPCDLGRDVFARLVGRMAGWELDAYVSDIGTPEGYQRVQAGVATVWKGKE